MNNDKLAEILAAKEERAIWLNQHIAQGKTLISATVNAMGPDKCTEDTRYVMEQIIEQLKGLFPQAMLLQTERVSGYEALWIIENTATLSAGKIKEMMCTIEEEHPLGRLMDLDVLDETGRHLSRTEVGVKPRQCLICDEVAVHCARNRTHSVEQLLRKSHQLIQDYKEKGEKYECSK